MLGVFVAVMLVHRCNDVLEQPSVAIVGEVLGHGDHAHAALLQLVPVEPNIEGIASKA